MGVYPDNVGKLVVSAAGAGVLDGESASGKAASLVCGCLVRFAIQIGPEARSVEDLKYTTNGCGFMIAAAESVTMLIRGRKLADLGGLTFLGDLHDLNKCGGSNGRSHCIDSVIESIRAALADLRMRTIGEYQGENALICTCFGVSEETVRSVIETNKVCTVNTVSSICNAGLGCGSCRMIIQEMIDSSQIGL